MMLQSFGASLFQNLLFFQKVGAGGNYSIYIKTRGSGSSGACVFGPVFLYCCVFSPYLD